MSDTVTAPTTTDIRAWAQTQPDLKVGKRGFLSAAVKDAYAAAHPAR